MSSRSIALVLPLAVVAVAAPALLRAADRDPAPARTAGIPAPVPAAASVIPTTATVVVEPAAVSVPVITMTATEPLGAESLAAEPVAATTIYRVAVELPLLGGPATAWRLDPVPDAHGALQTVLQVLAPGASLDSTFSPIGLPAGHEFLATGVRWRFTAPTLPRPIPDRCVGLDLSDPRAFPRCDAALAESKRAWRGGEAAIERARALWTTMGYDLAAYAVATTVDSDGYVVAHLRLDGGTVALGLRVRFQGTAVESADGILGVPQALADERLLAAGALIDLQAAGPTEVRGPDGAVLADTTAPRTVTIVGVEPSLVPVDIGSQVYVVPAVAFVGADGRRYVRPASSLAAAQGATGP